MIGYGPCFHMTEIIFDPKAPRKARQWKQIVDRDGNDVDWHKVFEGYVSAVDFPSALFYQEQMQAFPDAKVILTIRDPHKWYASARETILRNRHNFKSFPVNVGIWLVGLADLTDLVMNYGRLRCCTDAHDMDKMTEEGSVRRFNEWVEEVKRTVQPVDKLLVFEVSDGWEPLCRFLDVPVPPVPFPRVNDRDEFTTRQGNYMRLLTAIGWAAVVSAAGALAGCVWLVGHGIRKMSK
ncbi:unnamed protein product [Vitrella brassicaformis CCMP3155]|uniref:Sulfotransferase domain-containing protein n=1 Tax=Vitrella brassicaformis (strain CCMP3155) TaxID=1169540 RepID=A0A0G4EJP0_VITBC|nr:unnamed protein product [Vitrella brassicaformis CCMP3155]|eukprot:CEL96729.1 unnamed protein product [Vitrella brassicaformis CCMP3155]